MKFYTRYLLLWISLITLSLTGCGSGTAANPSETTVVESVAETEAAVQTGLVDISAVMKENQILYGSTMMGDRLVLFIGEPDYEEYDRMKQEGSQADSSADNPNDIQADDETDDKAESQNDSLADNQNADNQNDIQADDVTDDKGDSTEYFEENSEELEYNEDPMPYRWSMALVDMATREEIKRVDIPKLECFTYDCSFITPNDHEILAYNYMSDIGLVYDAELNTDGNEVHKLHDKYPDYIGELYEETPEDGGTNEEANESQMTNDETSLEESGNDGIAGDNDSFNMDDVVVKDTDDLQRVELPSMPLYIEDVYSDYNGYKVFGIGCDNAVLVIPSQPDKACVAKPEFFNRNVCNYESRFLWFEDSAATDSDPDAYEKPHHMTLGISNLMSGEEMNVLQTEEYDAKTLLSISYCSVNNTYAFIPLETFDEETGWDYKLFLWNYMADATHEPIEEVTVLTEELADKLNQELIAKIKEDYDIHVVTPYDADQEDYLLRISQIVRDCNPMDWNLGKAEAYVMLLQLQKDLGYFPKGMFTEMYKDIFNEYAIYLANEILDDSIGAFASNAWFFSDDMNEKAGEEGFGQVFVVHASRTFSETNIFHETMHTMEYHTTDDYFDGWFALNPASFSYEMNLFDNYELLEQLDFSYDKYFFSTYATKNDLEDRAVTFETMCTDSMSEYEPYWKDSETLKKKAAYLAKWIRDSYETVQNADGVIWEKVLEESKSSEEYDRIIKNTF